MNISKFTQKSIQAVQDLEKVAYEYGNQEDRAGASFVCTADTGGQPDSQTDREDGVSIKSILLT